MKNDSNKCAFERLDDYMAHFSSPGDIAAAEKYLIKTRNRDMLTERALGEIINGYKENATCRTQKAQDISER